MRWRPPFRPSALGVFAVGPTDIQVSWGALPTGEVVVRAGENQVSYDHPGGPGAATVNGLSPGTEYRIEVRSAAGVTHLVATTLRPPPGVVVARVATVSDLHLGAGHWGLLGTMIDLSGHPVPAPLRCARAAIAEAAAWGADLLVIKGDAAHHRRTDHFAAVGRLVDSFPDLAMTLIPGNHDVNATSSKPLPTTVGHRRLPFTRSVAIDDLPGVRVISLDSTIERRGVGTLRTHGPAALTAAAEAPGGSGVLMLFHHQIQRFRRATHYPPGIERDDGEDFLTGLVRANPNAWVSSGHSHRNRARRYGPIQLTEVASTRDWPGVWAGYEIREGGITQIVRRIEAPDAARWHEYSRGAVGGIWSAWSPGSLRDRCLSQTWIRPAPTDA